MRVVVHAKVVDVSVVVKAFLCSFRRVRLSCTINTNKTKTAIWLSVRVKLQRYNYISICTACFIGKRKHCTLLHMSSSCSGVFSISKCFGSLCVAPHKLISACAVIWAYKPVDVNRRDASVIRFPLTRIKAWFIFTYEIRILVLYSCTVKLHLLFFFYKYLI